MFSIPDLFNWAKSTFFPLSGGTLDSGATVNFSNAIGDKISLHGSGYGFAVNTFELTLYTPPSGDIVHRDGATGNILGTVWHSGNDGPGSGLNADLLDNASATESALALTIPKRTSNSDLVVRTINANFGNEASAIAAGAAMAFRTHETSDKILRFADRAKVITWLQAGGFATVTAAAYDGSCDAVGTSTDVTITPVSTSAAYIVPLVQLVATGPLGISEFKLLNSTTVRITHSSGYNGRYNFQVIS